MRVASPYAPLRQPARELRRERRRGLHLVDRQVILVHGTAPTFVDTFMEERAATFLESHVDIVSTAARKCARWRSESVPVGLKEKGRGALVCFCIAACGEACAA